MGEPHLLLYKRPAMPQGRLFSEVRLGMCEQAGHAMVPCPAASSSRTATPSPHLPPSVRPGADHCQWPRRGGWHPFSSLAGAMPSAPMNARGFSIFRWGLLGPGRAPWSGQSRPRAPVGPPLPPEVAMPTTSVQKLVPLSRLPGIKADTIVSSIEPGQRSDLTLPITMIFGRGFLWSAASVGRGRTMWGKGAQGRGGGRVG